MKKYVEQTYELTDIEVEDDNGCVRKVSGIFEVTDWQRYEPSAGITHEYFSITLTGVGEEPEDWEKSTYVVDPGELIKHIDPDRYEHERELEEIDAEREKEEES